MSSHDKPKRARWCLLGAVGVALAALVVWAAWTAKSPSGSTDATLSIRIGHIKAASGIPFFVALDDGGFREQGLDVTPTTYNTSDLAFAALKSGEIDAVGIAGLTQALQLAEERPGSVKVIGILNSSTCLIVAASDAAPTSVMDLQDRTVACFPGSVFSRFVQEALVAEGLDRARIKVKPYPPPLQIEALKQNEVAAVLTLEPTGAVAVAAGDARYLASSDLFAKHFLAGAKFPGGCTAVSRQYLRDHPGAEARLVAALDSALETVRSPRFDAARYLRRYTSTPAEFFGAVSFEGARFGRGIDRGPLLVLVERLREWKLVSATMDLGQVLD